MNEELKSFGEINTKLGNIQIRISVMEKLLNLAMEIESQDVLEVGAFSELLNICTVLPDVMCSSVGYFIADSILPLPNIKHYTQQYIDGVVPLSSFVSNITNWISEHKKAVEKLHSMRDEYKKHLEEERDSHLKAAKEAGEVLNQIYSALNEVEYAIVY